MSLDPSLQTFACRSRDLKLYRSLSLLLQHGSTGCDLATVADVLHAESCEVARPQLAVNREIEHREFPYVERHLQSSANCPNFAEPQWRFLPGEFCSKGAE